MLAAYRFVTVWHLEAPIDRVFAQMRREPPTSLVGDATGELEGIRQRLGGVAGTYTRED